MKVGETVVEVGGEVVEVGGAVVEVGGAVVEVGGAVVEVGGAVVEVGGAVVVFDAMGLWPRTHYEVVSDVQCSLLKVRSSASVPHFRGILSSLSSLLAILFL